MPTRAPDLLRLAALSALLGACPPAALLRTAEPTPAGQWRLGAGAAGGAIADRETGGRSGTGQVEVNLRRGVSPNADVGARLYTLGLGLDATLRFVHRGAWSVALAPELSALRTPSNSLTTDALHVFGRVAVPVTWRASSRWAFTAAPLLGAGAYLPGVEGWRGGLWLGFAVNAEARVGARSWLVLELSGYQVSAGEVPMRGGAVYAATGMRWSL